MSRGPERGRGPLCWARPQTSGLRTKNYGEREGIEAQIRERAQRDAEYRARLLADARGTLAADHEIDVPDTLAIRVVEESPDEVVIVVPPLRAAVDELDDSELEGVGAGWDFSGSDCGCPETVIC